MHWKKFDYQSLDEIKRDIDTLVVDLPLSEDLSVLAKNTELYGRTIANRLAIQPMEGLDGHFDGTPSDLTFRRYIQYAAGGAGLLWMESIATSQYSKTTPRQLHMSKGNLPVFQRLVGDIRKYAGHDDAPYLIAQLTFCGRGSHLDAGDLNTHPIPAYVAVRNPYLPCESGVIITDDEIEGVIDDYVKAAHFAKTAGFDAVDVRACHGYFLNEILSAFTREDSRYGGSFENRTRMMLTIIDRIRSEVGIDVVSRLNACDLIPYPYGWGMKQEPASMEIDLTEPLKLAGILLERGIRLLNISLGRNHVGHIQGPSNVGPLYPAEHQLTSVAFFQEMAYRFKQAYPRLLIMTGNFAWPRQFSANIAAGGIRNGHYDLAGFARMALANPSFANDILQKGGISPEDCCVGCQMCGALFDAAFVAGYPVGCVKRFPKIYAPYYKSWVQRRAVLEDPVPPNSVYPLKLFDLKPTMPADG